MMVNAVQRRACVVVHKPRQEGFGLSVAEAMWKSRAVVATDVGGISEQIVTGETGVLIGDPDDHSSFAQAIDELLRDPSRRKALGQAARRRIAERFSIMDHLADYLAVIQRRPLG
jgi:trehalose synthase